MEVEFVAGNVGRVEEREALNVIPMSVGHKNMRFALASPKILLQQCIAKLSNHPLPSPPRTTAYGALLAHLQDDTPREFAPMNINWGILPDPEEPTRDKGVKRAMKIAGDICIFTNSNLQFEEL